MKIQFFTVAACLSIIAFSSCQQPQTSQTAQSDSTQQVVDTAAVAATTAADTSSAAVLETVMSAPEKAKAGKPILLKFTVTNNTDKEESFCKWHTPFEQRWMNNFFDVTDAKGEPVQYKGAMAKRMMPPPADAYVKVPAKGSVNAEIDLATGYNITAPGTYKVVYNGEGVSGLGKVNEVSITVE